MRILYFSNGLFAHKYSFSHTKNQFIQELSRNVDFIFRRIDYLCFL